MTAQPLCPECGSNDVSTTPVPGLWVQFWCNACEHFWWKKSTTEASQDPSTRRL